MWIVGITSLLFLVGLLYWLLVTTEGVFLGRRIVVWLYDVTAHKYDGIKEFEPEWEQFFIAQPLMHRLGDIPAPLILDVATGTGRVPLTLLDQPRFNGRLITLDPSPKMLALAVDKLRPFRHRVTFVQQTAVPLPFPNQTFHAVTCLESLEFFPSETAAVQEMVRVLRPGGVLMLTRRRGWEGKAFLTKYRNVATFEQMLTDCGLIEVSTQPWQFAYDLVIAEKG